MNICIITVYNSENCGSFLQAYALKNALEKLGHNTCFLKRNIKGTAHSLKPHIEDSIKKLIKFQFNEFRFIWKRYKAFTNAQTLFPVIDKHTEHYDKIDCFVIGSDTVWNLNSKYFSKNMDIYFGNSLGDKKIITYAVSAANTPKEKFVNNRTVAEGIQKISDLSVRDTATYEIVKDVFHTESEIVCDPTLLLNKEDYNALVENEVTFPQSPILIYYFGNLPDNSVKQILKLKKETGKQIISFGQYRAWCDINIPFDPYLFIRSYRDCSFVITNTFHGTIFSLIYQKNFANYGQEKKKIEHLLTSLGAENTFALDSDDLLPYYKNNLDYDTINKKIEEQKNSSMHYLKRNLNI
ncbi:MAG: polysaccharide pyruvyl transferase family protein [Clostridium sp.]|nr:polysaccharide pyruvyl transferase family protein [Clostridium sp.]